MAVEPGSPPCLHHDDQADEEKQAGKQGGEPGLPAQLEGSLESLPLIFSTDEKTMLDKCRASIDVAKIRAISKIVTSRKVWKCL